MADTILPIVAEFQTIEGAQEWRANQGGWIFASDCGRFLWFDLRITAGRVMVSPCVRGMDGTLV